jgi:hypothetical protein
MQAHPMITTLRRAPAAQAECDAAVAAWLALPMVAEVLAQLAPFDAGEQLGDLPALARIVGDSRAAQVFADALITPLMAALQDEPLAQVPLSHSARPGMARLRLASHGRSALSLTALSLTAFAPRAASGAASVLFEDCTVHEIVVAGAAQMALFRLDGARLTRSEVSCAPGTRLTRSGPNDTRQIIEVSQPLLVLQLTREAAEPAPSREIALDDGRLITAISGSKQTSQQIMALGVLGALAHRPALEPMAQVVRNPTAARDLRWEALRQALALDAAFGLALLAALASGPDDGPDDELQAPAAALQQQLFATRPDLAALMGQPA